MPGLSAAAYRAVWDSRKASREVQRYFGLSPSCPVSLVCLVPDEIDKVDQRDQTDERRVLVSCGKTILACVSVAAQWHTRSTSPQDAQKGRPARPQRVKTRGVPSGYVEDLNDVRTPLADFFSILLELGGECSPIGDGNDSVHDGMDAAEVRVATGSQPWKCKAAVWPDDSGVECAGVPIF